MGSAYLFVAMAAYGVYYAISPVRSLRRRFSDEEITEEKIKTARIIGVVTAVVGAVAAIILFIKNS